MVSTTIVLSGSPGSAMTVGIIRNLQDVQTGLLDTAEELAEHEKSVRIRSPS